MIFFIAQLQFEFLPSFKQFKRTASDGLRPYFQPHYVRLNLSLHKR